MINIPLFIKYLWRFKWLIIFVPIFGVISTYFLVKDLPKKYKSTAQIATGITDRFQEIVSGGSMDYFRVNQQFGNVMELMKTKRVVDILSYQLILHDLANPSEPFKAYPTELAVLSDDQRKDIIALYNEMAGKNQLLTPQANGKYLLFDYLKMLGYDNESLLNDLFVYRKGDSDFINVQFTSESPELSAFVVNTYLSEFIDYYGTSATVTQSNSIALLDSVLREKEAKMNALNAQLESYKSNRGAINLSSQSEVLFQQISEQENRRSQAISEIQSLRGAIRGIDEKLRTGKQDVGAEGTINQNNEVIQLGRQLDQANKRYVDNGFNEVDKRIVDSLQQLRSLRIAQLSRNSQGGDGQEIRSDMLKERQSMEIALSKVESSMQSIDATLGGLKSKYYAMVPADANIQNYEREANLALKEYTDALERYNQAKLQNTASLRLRIVEVGYPGLPEPSKTLIYLAMSGFASGAVIITTLLLMFLMNRSITDPKQLANITGIPVLGSLNYLKDHDKDLRLIWNDGDDNKDYAIYRDLLRSLRFEINQKLLDPGGKVLGITSMSAADGKTFLASSLAYAFAMIGKKVLLIGEEYPNLTELISSKKNTTTQGFESFVIKKEILTEDLITVLNKNPESTSLLEIKDSTSITLAFEVLRKEFDIIIIDINNLKSINQIKEWLMFTDKNIAVFSSGSTLSDRDMEFLNNLKRHQGYLGWVMNKISLTDEGSLV